MSITLERISLKKAGRFLFQGLCFKAEKKDFIEIIGPNGCGKTSLLKVIAGLTKPTEGKVYFSPSSQRSLYLSLLTGFDEELTVYKNLETLCILEQQPFINASFILEKMRLFSLKDQPFHTLSAGQRQRAHLARLLILERPYWLLDEPLTSLDQEGEEIFKEICKAHIKLGGIIFTASPKPLGLGISLFIKDYAPPFISHCDSWEDL